LEGRVAVGQLAWVPFGRQQAQGVIVALDEVAPVAELRDLSGIVDDKPALTTAQIELARWMSLYYLSPLFDTLSLMIPRGVVRQARTTVTVVDSVFSLTDLPPQERAALSALQTEGPIPLAKAEKRVGKALIRDLISKGWLRQRDETPPPRVRPETARFVRLLLDKEQVPTALSQLRRAAKQAQVLEILQQRGEPMMVRELRETIKLSGSALEELQKRGWIAIEERSIWRDPLAGREFVLTSPPPFTREQEQVWQALASSWDSGVSHVYLIHGVTGSGKTEIYLRAALETLKRGKQAIILVPEISLTPQTIQRFAARFPGRLAVIHSRLSAGERYDEWRRIRDGLADVVIGPRSALFSPLARLGLIVLDEEHESSYKQEPIPGQQLPAYHARDVAVKLGQLTGAQVILGSATPSLSSYYRAERGEYALLKLPQRVMGHRRQWDEQRARYGIQGARYRAREVGAESQEALYMEMPPVQVVDLRQELRAGNRSIFSRALQKAMAEALAAHEQVILFVNRRGAATFVICRDCGHVLKCPRCAIPLTYHSSGEKLLCHRCGYRSPSPESCPNCEGKRIRFFGIGTQKVEEVARGAFPTARILRWDSDVITAQTSHEALLEQFATHQADILIGTQMIAKGLDLPLVTLVGVITADTALYLPDYQAAERTFQLLTQVAGRAGRSILGGRVIIQTYTPEHYAIQAASRHDYEDFHRHEMAFRRAQWYPPLSRLVRLVYLAEHENRAEQESRRLYQLLVEQKERLALSGLDIIGPAPCFFSPWQGRYRWQILLRGAELHSLLEAIPLTPGWQVDVDPATVL